MTGTGLAAEYGFYYCWPKNMEEILNKTTTQSRDLETDWIPLWYSLSDEKDITGITQSLMIAKNILKRFEDCTPG